MEPSNYIGRAPSQVEDFIRDNVGPAIEGIEFGNMKSELKV
jgi:hypothetical protein